MDYEDDWEQAREDEARAEDEHEDGYEDQPQHFEALRMLDLANQLEDYWKRGKGAIKIRWGTPGDWTRCYHHIKKHVPDESAKRICAQWHRDQVGFYPGDRRNK